ncbi:MAG: hypothetical protein IPG53_02910 [Ignavibacteriales bacterium]|nr:hypothetical protein [Ignavibacteriales bacterium]
MKTIKIESFTDWNVVSNVNASCPFHFLIPINLSFRKISHCEHNYMEQQLLLIRED